MSRRRELERRCRTLGEIRNIMDSMKTLAYLETRKLTRFLAAQRAVVAHQRAVADDLLAHYPETLAPAVPSLSVYVLIGSERGFCGSFNQTILTAWDAVAETAGGAAVVLPVGRRLCAHLEGSPRAAAFVAGAATVDEVPDTLNRITDALASLQARHGGLAVTAVYHDPDLTEVAIERLLPPFGAPEVRRRRFACPPMLTLPPDAFLAALVDEYLFATLHQLLYLSLMAENLRRTQHLDGAVRHLDDETAALQRRVNAARQQEIIEEIEVILLSAGQTEGPLPGRPGDARK